MNVIIDNDFKYSWLEDPENCPIEELEKQLVELENNVSFFDTKQLAIKKFINSVYGALGSKYFVAHNTRMAESITAQGRDLNHYSENSVNRYFKGLFQSNPKITLYYQWTYHTPEGKKLTFASDEKPEDYYVNGKWEECDRFAPAISKGKKVTKETIACLKDNSVGHCDWFMTTVDLFTKLGMTEEQKEKAAKFDISYGMTTDVGELTGPEFDYLEGTRSLVCGGDTDSFSSDTQIVMKIGSSFTLTKVSDFFDKMKEENGHFVMKTTNGSEVIPVKEYQAQTYDEKSDKVDFRPINYVMRHKVKKAKFRITTESGKQVIVTGDHSCMVLRDGKLMSIKAKDIDKNKDKMITI